MDPDCTILRRDTVLLRSKSITSSDQGGYQLSFGVARPLVPVLEPKELPDDSIVMHIGAPGPATCMLDGKSQTRIERVGDFDIIPAGLAPRWQKDVSAEAFHISWDASFATQVRGDGPAGASPLPELQLRDQQLHNIASALLAEHRSQSVGGKLYIESLMTAFVLRLETVQRKAAFEGSWAPGCLSPTQQRQIAGFIQEHIDADLSLSTLAAVVGLGLSQFKTLFKATFGCSPHRYILNLRMDYATRLIVDGKLPLKQIALEAGFASQSHMTSMFRQVRGLSPGQFRKTLKD